MVKVIDIGKNGYSSVSILAQWVYLHAKFEIDQMLNL